MTEQLVLRDLSPVEWLESPENPGTRADSAAQRVYVRRIFEFLPGDDECFCPPDGEHPDWYRTCGDSYRFNPKLPGDAAAEFFVKNGWIPLPERLGVK